MSIKSLSILIPTYRCACYNLVKSLQEQASRMEGLEYEILVSDDGSGSHVSTDINRRINDLPHCTLLEQPDNAGRSINRNLLARRAKHEWLLYIDSHMHVVRHDYIRKYTENAHDGQLTCGGYSLPHPTDTAAKHSLRYRYEHHCARQLTLETRSLRPHHNFHTSNFLIQRKLMLQHPFDERINIYGYEDVLFGKTLQQNDIKVNHIDNPVGFNTFEDNASFLRKTEDSLHTLHAFRHQLEDYSTLLTLYNRLHKWHLTPALRIFHKLSGNILRRHLTASRPSARLFQLYKLGYYTTLAQHPAD